MNRATFRVIAFTLAALVIAPTPCRAQESRPHAATMPSDSELREGLDQLLKGLGQSNLDWGLDGLSDAKARNVAVRAAIATFTEEVRKRAVDDGAAELMARDCITLLNEALPRLSGRTVRVGEGHEYKNFAEAQPNLIAGDLIVLGAGTFRLTKSANSALPDDVAIVGGGVNRTTLFIERSARIERANRLLIEDVRIDCLESPLTNLRTGSGLILRRCELMNYNSGVGGSNALYADSGVVAVEDCLFDGASGRSAGRGNLGTALDVRGKSAIVFARRCQFVDHAEVDRATGMRVFDHCTMLNTGRSEGVMPYSGAIWLRESESMLLPAERNGPTIHRFGRATDDVEFIEFVLDASKPIDEDSKKLAATLQLHRRLPYWIGLIHHEDARIRGLAAKKVEELTGEEVRLPKEQPREGERLIDAGMPLEIEKEYARLMNWFDANRERLAWDQEAGRYRMAEQPE